MNISIEAINSYGDKVFIKTSSKTMVWPILIRNLCWSAFIRQHNRISTTSTKGWDEYILNNISPFPTLKLDLLQGGESWSTTWGNEIREIFERSFLSDPVTFGSCLITRHTSLNTPSIRMPFSHSLSLRHQGASM